MPGEGETIFHFRPMFNLAAGFILGIVLSEYFKGTLAYIAPCLFACLFYVSLRLGLERHAAFSLAMSLGLIRMLFGPVSIPPAAMAPFQHTRAALLSSADVLFGQHAPILRAMLWGYKAGISDAIYDVYRGSGTAHVLALSGLHISFVAGIIDKLACRCRPRIKFRIAASVFFTYCAIASFPPSLVRASVMNLCAMYASVAGRKYDLASGVSLAALIILAFDPSALRDIGFQLSFGAVASIAMVMPVLSRRLSFLPESISGLISVSVCGTLGTLPLSAYYFGSIPVLGLFANVLIMPIVPVVYVSALAACILGALIPFAGAILAPVPVFLAGAMEAAARTISSLSFAVQPASVTPLFCAFVYIALFCLSDYPLTTGKNKLSVCCMALSAAVVCLVFA